MNRETSERAENTIGREQAEQFCDGLTISIDQFLLMDLITERFPRLHSQISLLLERCLPQNPEAQELCFEKFSVSYLCEDDSFTSEPQLVTFIQRLAEYSDIQNFPQAIERGKTDKLLFNAYMALAEELVKHSVFSRFAQIGVSRDSGALKLSNIDDFSIIKCLGTNDIFMKVPDPVETTAPNVWIMRVASHLREKSEDFHDRRQLTGSELWSFDENFVLLAPPPPWKPRKPKFELLNCQTDHELSAKLVEARKQDSIGRVHAVGLLALDYPEFCQGLLEEAVYWCRDYIANRPRDKYYPDYKSDSQILTELVNKLEQRDIAVASSAVELFSQTVRARGDLAHWFADLAMGTEFYREHAVKQALQYSVGPSGVENESLKIIASKWYQSGMENAGLMALNLIERPETYALTITRMFNFKPEIPEDLLEKFKCDIARVSEGADRYFNPPQFLLLARASLLYYMPEQESRDWARSILSDTDLTIDARYLAPIAVALMPYVEEKQLVEVISKITNEPSQNVPAGKQETSLSICMLTLETFRKEAREALLDSEHDVFFPKSIEALLAPQTPSERQNAVNEIFDNRMSAGRLFNEIEFIGPYLTDQQRQILDSEIRKSPSLHRDASGREEERDYFLRAIHFNETELQRYVCNYARHIMFGLF